MLNPCYVEDDLAVIEVIDEEEDKKHKVIFDACYLPYVLEGNFNEVYKIEKKTEKKTYKNQHGTHTKYIKKNSDVYKEVGRGGKKVYLKDIILNPANNEEVHVIDSSFNLTFENMLLLDKES